MKIITVDRNLETIGELDRQQFTVKMDAHMMDILSGLYSDIIWAVVREYWSNAEDGHEVLLAQGKTPSKKIEIHVPNDLEPWFEVKDYGIGMDHNTVFNVYTQYGSTLKGDENLSKGGFGLGAKSAFCYERGTDQWTIESRFEGTIRTYVAAKGKKGMAELILLGESPTEEDTGIAVRIPVAARDIPAFRTAISKFAKRRGPTFGTGHEFVILGDVAGIEAGNYTEIKYGSQTDKFGWRPRNSAEVGVQVIMGGIPYPVDIANPDLGLTRQEREFLNKQSSVDMFFEIGEIQMVPSREGLKYTPETIAAIKTRFPVLFEDTVTTFLSGIKKCETLWEALRFKANNQEACLIAESSLGGNHTVEYNGEVLFTKTMSVALDDIVTAHGTVVPEKLRVMVLSKNWNRKVTRSGDAVPAKDLEVIDGVLQTYSNDVEIRTSLSLTLEEAEATEDAPRVVVADCSAAVGMARKYWSNAGGRGSGYGSNLYVFLGKDLQPDVISKCFDGIVVGSLKELTKNYSSPTSLSNILQTRTIAMLHKWQKGYFTNYEVDLAKGGLYIPLNRGDIDVSALPKAWKPITTNRKLGTVIDALKRAGFLSEDTPIIGIPRTRKTQIQKLTNWQPLWEAQGSNVTRIMNFAVPDKYKDADHVKAEMANLSFIGTAAKLTQHGHVIASNSPIGKLVAAAERKDDAIQKQADNILRYDTILSLRMLLRGSADGKKAARKATLVDIEALKGYNEYLITRYEMLRILSITMFAFNRALTNNHEAIMNYINVIDANVSTKNAPKLT